MMKWMDIRILEKEDAGALFGVEKQCFSAPWSEKMFLGDLESENTVYIGAFMENVLVGYAGAWIVAGDSDITNVAVIPSQRGKGIAKELLKRLFSELVKRDGENVRLEVRESNKNAKKLYEKMGFYKIDVRKNYYSDNKEDALIYEKRL